MVERGNRVYKFEHTLLHFVNVIAIVGMTFPIVYRAFFSSQNTKNEFARALNFIVWGFIIFFFLSTFKGHVQAQWVLAIAIPLGILTFWYLIDHPQSRTWFIALACVNFLFMIVARVQLVTPVLPLNMETHGNEKWTHALKLKTEGQQKYLSIPTDILLHTGFIRENLRSTLETILGGIIIFSYYKRIQIFLQRK